MGIVVRQMEIGEAAAVYQIGKRAFTGMERLFLNQPKQALVAVTDEKLVGAILYTVFQCDGKKTGYLDYAFIEPDFHHQGVGGVLYKAAMDFLWEQGCDVLTALVRDDNIGSWRLLLKNGFSRVSLPELVRQFGVSGMLRHYFGTPFCVGVGMEYYVALREQPCPSGKGRSMKQIASYLLANFLLFFLMLLHAPESIGTAFAAYFILLAGGIAAGYVGARLTKRRWRFRLNNGGVLVGILVNFLGGVYPLIGNWYPDHYESTGSFRRDMGINALAGWIFVLALSAVSVLGIRQTVLFRYIGQIGSLLLFYRVLAFYPFESFGGRRVYCWNRWLYLLMSALSLALFVAPFIL